MTDKQLRSDKATVEYPSRGGRDTQTLQRDQLFSPSSAASYLARWEQVQTRFVDDPRATVGEADELVTDVIDELTRTFQSERRFLEQEWTNAEPSTEDLRIALRRYRAFFNRLLASQHDWQDGEAQGPQDRGEAGTERRTDAQQG